jgi:arylsulfatase A-like enzyme
MILLPKLLSPARPPYFLQKLIDSAVSASITYEILRSKVFLIGMTGFLISQFILYGIYIALVWYLATSASQAFKLTKRQCYWLGVFLLAETMIGILAANTIYIPYSFFAVFLKNYIFKNQLTNFTLMLTLSMSIAITGLALLAAGIHLLRKRWQLRDKIFIAFVVLVSTICVYQYFAATPAFVASAEKPNVIVIGIDALRPDFISFYNPEKPATPNIDNFLASGSNFASAYATLPRTFPSWASILTGRYPKHNHARGNNTDLSEIDVAETLPKTLQKAGYETVYGTDDTRFNNTNQIFGFDHVVTPPMGLNDFLIGTMNDFPLSNLIIPTPLGRILFPFNYANHGTPMTYLPSNFLQLLNETLHQRQQKPLFMAVHFTITHWPYYWFNIKKPAGCHDLCRYSAGVSEGDQQFADFMHTLKANGILDHAIVILLSDHGTSLGIPGDRNVTEAAYQGANKENIKKLSFYKYAEEISPVPRLELNTSYGYGGDILSMVQYHALLAFKGFNVATGTPRTIHDRVLLMDIAPTLLDILQLPILRQADGISLKPYLLQQKMADAKTRPFFLESSFTLEEIEQEGISVTKVLAKTVRLFRLDPSGLIFIKPAAERSMSRNKQVAIIQGDWMLAHYPSIAKFALVIDKKTQNMIYDTGIKPQYMVLLNLRTGKWTTELDSPFARTAPLASLTSQLKDFYQSELML